MSTCTVEVAETLERQVEAILGKAISEANAILIASAEKVAALRRSAAQEPACCEAEDYTKSTQFVDGVNRVIDAYMLRTTPTPCTEGATGASEPYPIQYWKDRDGLGWYGFWVGRSFVHFTNREAAVKGREDQIFAPGSVLWAYKDLTGGTRLD